MNTNLKVYAADDNPERVYIEFPDIRLIFENGSYIGFTQPNLSAVV